MQHREHYRHVIVTGSSRGIGRRIVETFTALGDRVSCCARSESYDGPTTDDVLVNNAGIVRDRSIALMTPEEWDEVVRTNLYGAFNVCNAVALPMMRGGGE